MSRFKKGNIIGVKTRFQKGHIGFGTPESYKKAGKKISETKKKQIEKYGYLNSPEARKKMSATMIERYAKGEVIGFQKGNKYGKLNKGKKTGIFPKNGFKKGTTPWNKGKKQSLKTRMKISESRKRYDSVHYLIKKIRRNTTYREWRDAVFTRDNWTCCSCHSVGCKLQAHHLITFSQLIKDNNIKTLKQAIQCKELWDISNGQTLCLKCHRLTDSYGFRGTYKPTR